MDNISISLFRVSSDSKYLDMIFSCSKDEFFSSLIINVKSIKEKETISEDFDLSQALFSEDTRKKSHWHVRLPLESLGYGPKRPAIYTATFKTQQQEIQNCKYKIRTASYNSQDPEWEKGYSYFAHPTITDTVLYHFSTYEDDAVSVEFTVDLNTWFPIEAQNNQYVYTIPLEQGAEEYFTVVRVTNSKGESFMTEPLLFYPDRKLQEEVNPLECEIFIREGSEDSAICSDVNNIYYTLVDGIINPGDRCTTISDEVIRNYIILYAHLQALDKREYDEALLYFKMINSHFDNCGNFKRLPHRHINSCNCVRR